MNDLHECGMAMWRVGVFDGVVLGCAFLIVVAMCVVSVAVSEVQR